jgi:Stage II sporulation protein E (SpoIIE)
VSDDQDMTAGRGDGPAEYLLPPRLSLPDATPDPARLARRVLHAVIPGFADAAGIFVLEELLSGNPAGHTAATASAALVVRRLAGGSAGSGEFPAEEAFPPGQVLALAADSPFARCLSDGAPVTFAQPDGTTLRRISPKTKTALAAYTSFLAAPMIIRGTAAGFLVLARAPAAPAFGDADTHAAADLAARAGAGLAGSLALMRHRSVAEVLAPPRRAVSRVAPGQLEIAGRCLPAAGTDAGGDWYDIIPLPGERTGLIVGDVMGHGPEAATVMTRLSAAAYALADLDMPPGEVLRQLNRTAIALPQATLVTCAYAVIDPGDQSCDIATAGHLPPVLALPDGTTRVPGLPGGQSLGVTAASYGQARVRLRPGTILALYTDGLVETRTRPFDQGILALRSALSGQHQHLDATCEEVISALGETGEDDITVVLARIPPG